jgi:hypothetical protein
MLTEQLQRRHRRGIYPVARLALFGVVNLVAVIIIARLTISGFASAWCGWSAVSSAAITLHCRFAKPHPHQARSGSGGLMSVS